MAIFGNQGIGLTVKALQAGQLCVSTLSYAVADVAQWVTPTEFLDFFLSGPYLEWKGIVSEDVLITSVSVDSFPGINTPAFTTVTEFPNEQGSVVSEALPPHVSMRLYKTPDNSSIDPSPGASTFRPGMLRISGVPESAQDNGLLTPTHKGLLDTLGNSLPLFLVPSGAFAPTVTVRQTMVRAAGAIPGEPQAVAYVAAMTAGAVLGSQNSRKI